MTVSSEVADISYAGDGVTVAFSIPFNFLSNSDIQVSTRDAAGDTAVLSTGFSITGAGTGSGTCTFDVAPDDVDIIIERAPEILQPMDLTPNDRFPAETIEAAHDRQTYISQWISRLVQRSIRLPVGDASVGGGAILDAASSRLGKVLYFNDVTGAPEMLSVGDVAGLATALTSTIIATTLDSLKRTAAEIAAGVTPTNYAYPPGDIRRYGAAMDGVTDDSAAFQAAGLASLHPYAPAGPTLITSSIPIIDNQHWRLDGTRIQITGTTLKVFTVAAGVDDWSVDGDWSVTGDNGAAGATSGTAAAIAIIDSMRWRVGNLTAKNISGWGVLVQPGSSTSNRTEHGQAVNLQAVACYRGAEVQPGNGAEYVTFVAPLITRCAVGFKATAGNVNVTGGSISDNTVGVQLLAGSNGHHGMFVGTNINHNDTYNVQTEDVTNGHTFVGCHLYEGDIYLKDSEGVMFESCIVDPASFYFEGSDGCGFRNCRMPQGYANTINNNYNASPSYTIWDNCRDLNGKLFPVTTTGMYKGIRVKATSPAIVYTPANLTAEQTILLTDAENFTAEASQTLYDGYDATTGVFTCRGLGDGMVRVNAALAVTHNAADDMGSVFVYIRKNGSGAYRYLTRTQLTTTKVMFSFDGVIELAATETIQFRIGQTSGVANNVTVATAETEVIVEGL